MERIARDMREQLPGVSDTLSFPGGGGGGFGQTNAGSLFVRLKPIDEREFTQQELIARARRMVQPYRQSAVISIQAAGGLVALSGRGAQIQYALVGTGPAEARPVHRTRAAAALSKNETLVDVDRTYLPGRPELRLNIDRKRAGDLGVRVQDISQTVNALVAGQKVTTFNAASDQYDVVLRAQDSFRRTPESIAAATVRTGTGELVQLRNLVTLNEGAGPAAIERLNRQRQISVSANPAPGRAQAEGQKVVEDTFRSLDMEPGYYAGDQRIARESSAAPPTTSASPSRCRSCSCTWCWRRSSNRSSTRSRSC